MRSNTGSSRGCEQANEGRKEVRTMLTVYIRYVRYLVSTLATVGFGIALN
jgi:hypothetical protein